MEAALNGSPMTDASQPARAPAPPWQEVKAADGIEAAWEAMRNAEGEEENRGRALALNLICRAQDGADAERLAGWAWALGPRHPARVFIINPEAAQPGRVRVRAAAEAGGSELAEVAAAPERAASVATPLLEGDLPVLLLWHGDSYSAGADFEGWAQVADRVLVDSHRMRMGARALAELATGLRAGCTLADLTWTRLTPWRQLLCQGLESAPGAFRRIASVQITAGHGRSLAPGEAWRPSASLASTLLAGWLAEQLGWPAASVGSRLQLEYELGEGKIELGFEPCPAHERHGLLRQLQVVTRDGLEIEVEHKGQKLELRVHAGSQLLGEWLSPAGEGIRSERDALCEEFSLYGRDEQFQGALTRGVEMLQQLEGSAA